MPLTQEDCAVSYKLLMLGVSGVGKSCILQSLVGRQFPEKTLPTVGPDFVTKIIEVDGALVSLYVWDTSGLEQFRSVRRQQYRGTQGVMLVYDVTNRDSYTPLMYWITTIEQEIRHNHHEYEPIPIILCGNKTDMADQREVDTEEGEMLVNQKKVFEFFETSAKTGENVFQAFHRLAYHVTDICHPQLMKSYHPFMIKETDAHKGQRTSSPAKGRWKLRLKILQKNNKNKNKNKKKKKGNGKDGSGGFFQCSVLSCCRSVRS